MTGRVASSGTYASAPLDVEVEETVPASTLPAIDVEAAVPESTLPAIDVPTGG